MTNEAGPTQRDDTLDLTRQRPERVRTGRAAQINNWLDVIQKLKADRIDEWKVIAKSKEPKPLRQALDVAVTIVAGGFGGVAGAFISGPMAHSLFKEFVYLSGLEAADMAAEYIYKAALENTQEKLAKATKDALDFSKISNVNTALSEADDLVEIYTHAINLQTIAEQAQQGKQFNTTSADLSDPALIDQSNVLELLYQQLMGTPEVFLRELTEGFIRLMDENKILKHSEDYGGDRARTLKEDTSLRDTEERQGNLLVLPGVSFSLGTWGNPRLNFPDFYALATGANTKTLMKLAGTPIKDLPLTLGFRYWVEDPFYRILRGGMVKVWFTGQAEGQIWLEDGLGESALEWLASYYLGASRELIDKERQTNAPLGARKLYEATKDKPINKLSNSDLL